MAYPPIVTWQGQLFRLQLTEALAYLEGIATGLPPDADYGDITITGGVWAVEDNSHNHVAANITDFAEATDDRVAALAVAGTNMSITYNDGANTLTFAASSGGQATGQWRFDTSTTMADPGTGDVRLDTTGFATVTQMAISETTNPGTDAQNVLGVLKAGDIFYIQDQDDATKWARYDIDAAGTDNGAWWLFALTYVNGGAGGLPANNQVCTISAYLQGAAAGGGADVPLMHWVV